MRGAAYSHRPFAAGAGNASGETVNIMNWKKNLLFIWLSQFLSTMGFSFATPFIPFYIKELGGGGAAEQGMWVALFAASGNLSLFIFSPIWGTLSDIYGRRLMVLRANFGCGLLMPLMAVVPGVGWLVALRFLVGAFAGTVTASQILVSSATPWAHRGFAMGLLSSSVYGGTIAGMFLGGALADTFGYRNSFFLSGIALVISGFLTVFGVREDFHRTSALKEKLKDFKLKPPAFGSAWLILLLILLMGFASRFDLPFLPMLVETVNGPDKAALWTGTISGVAAIAGLFSGSLMGWMADRHSAPKVAVWSALLSGLLLIPQGLATGMAMLLSARVGMVFFVGGLDPVFQIWLAKSTPDHKRGQFFGWATSAKSFGWFLCSLASGGVAMSLGIRWVYLVAAVLFLALIPVIKGTAAKIESKACR